MVNQKAGKTLALIGGILSVLLAVYSIYMIFFSYGYSFLLRYDLLTLAIYVIETAGWGLLAVSLFTGNKIFALIAAGAHTLNVLLWVAYRVAYYVSYGVWNIDSLLPYVLQLLAFVALGILALLSKKEQKAVKALCLIPAGVMFLGFVVELIGAISVGYIIYGWEFILYTLVSIAALLLAGLWLGARTDGAAAGQGYQQPVYQQPTYQQPAYQQRPAYPQQPTYQQPVYQQPAYQQPVYQQRPAYPQQPTYQQPVYQQPAAPAAPAASGGAEKLRELKGLLDAGIITQEEFDQKKARILDQL